MIISVYVCAVLTTSETILNFILIVLMRKDMNIYILYQISLKHYYGYITLILDKGFTYESKKEIGFMRISGNNPTHYIIISFTILNNCDTQIIRHLDNFY